MERREVFISYKSEDIAQAKWLRTVLESNGISCWMAPANIPGGSDYAKEIPQAIENCRVFVLVFTQKCQESVWIPKELGIALGEKKPVMPFVLENCELTDDFMFYLTNVQHYPAYDDSISAAEQMLHDIRALLSMPQTPVRPIPSAPRLRRTGKWNLRKLLPVAGIALAICLLIGLISALPSCEGPGVKTLKPKDIACETVTAVGQKLERYLDGAGQNTYTLHIENGETMDLTGEEMHSAMTDLAVLEEGYVANQGGAEPLLILAFSVGLEDLPRYWVNNTFYEDMILLDYPAVYGYAVASGLSLDAKGRIEEGEVPHLTVGSLYENENAMWMEIETMYAAAGLEKGAWPQENP